MANVVFICGCETKGIIARENVATMDTVMFDDEGFLACMVHHQRRQGWRSLPAVPGLKLSDWAFAHMTPLQREAFVLFGEIPSEPRMTLKSGVDRRDNRDPLTLGRQLTQWRDSNFDVKSLRMAYDRFSH